MEMWIWIPGIPGLPTNNGWIEVFGLSQPGTRKEVSVTIARDAAASRIMSKCITGDGISIIIVALGPQVEFHYTNAIIASASGGGGPEMSFSFNYETISRKYSA